MKSISTIMGLTFIGLMLLALGVATAMWMETLWINTYIETGEVRVAWTEWTCSDQGPDPQAGEPFHNEEGKNVAQCIVTPEIYDDEQNVIKVNITLVNAYPGYAPFITLYAGNIGTIPVKLLNYTNLQYDEEPLTVYLDIPEDTQIHPGESLPIGIHIIVNQEAEELTTYSFELEFTFAQWNEVP
ncbi:hypothetical protein IMZ38_02185 [Thermosphaera chiliense]|uniref:Uncharacterized protein n=1 Tax=Thermosphaera chiliense TaxID=3402707 RepID=A0A7M1URE4_9CREN|nr:hypothetical protein [Thermosphaera aggregans]QOR94761.1 hypothetical protein IMZ38_02185 [Thermosphaera aggregans]